LVPGCLSGFGDPGVSLEGAGEGVERADAVAGGGGGEVGTDRAELLGAGGPGGFGRVLESEERVDRLPRPRPVQVVPVSVTAVSSRSRWELHKVWPAMLS
jgi:hypothetical protein